MQSATLRKETSNAQGLTDSPAEKDTGVEMDHRSQKDYIIEKKSNIILEIINRNIIYKT